MERHKRDIEIIERLKLLISERVKVHEIKVFGSRARGDATPESDLDVFIVVDYLDYAVERHISDCAWEIGFSEDVVIVPLVVSLDTLKNSPIRESVFIKNVYREGITV